MSQDSFDLDGVGDDDSGVVTDVSSRPTAFGDMGEPDVYRDDGTPRVDTNRADSTDQVDIRKLVREPTLSDIRWIYRNTFAKVLVDKPIDDAFKNWFDLMNDPSGSVESILDDYLKSYQLGEKKARRDGFSVLFHVYEDSDSGPHVAPTRESFNDYLGSNVLTVDDLRDVSANEIEDQVPDGYGRRSDGSFNYECRKSGLVLSKKINDINWNDPIGVVLNQRRESEAGRETGNHQFAHIDRLQILTWNEEVDGDYHRDELHRYSELRQDNTTIGKWEGDSELQSVYHLIKDLFKGNWSIMQTAFRYASPFYQVSVPARDAQDEEQFQAARRMFNNLNAMSEGVFPEDYDLELHDTEGNFDPEGYFNPIFEQVCAGTEMPKSVLFGTQAGTVSGSETDVMGYYNQVNRLQNNRIEDKIWEFVQQINSLSNSLVPNFSLGYQIEWNPLFELNELEKAENVRTILNAVTQIGNQYALLPNEMRDITAECLDDLGYEVDLSEDLTIEDFDLLADLNLAAGSNNVPMPVQIAQEMASKGMTMAEGLEAQEMGNPRVGQNVGAGNNPNSESQASSQPQNDELT